MSSISYLFTRNYEDADVTILYALGITDTSNALTASTRQMVINIVDKTSASFQTFPTVHRHNASTCAATKETSYGMHDQFSALYLLNVVLFKFGVFTNLYLPRILRSLKKRSNQKTSHAETPRDSEFRPQKRTRTRKVILKMAGP